MTQSRGPTRRLRRLRWTWTFLSAATLALVVAGALLWPRTGGERHLPGEEVEGITRRLADDAPGDAPVAAFVDVTEESGLAFRTFAGSRTSQLPEDMGSGAAFGDYDDDGDDDLFLVSAGGPLGASEADLAPSLLFENLGDGRFRRVDSFPETRIHGMGAAWGDADGDGRLDLVVTSYGSILLFRNLGSGRFERDRRLEAPAGYWAGASWGDYDADGDLDLYVCGYVRYVEPESAAREASFQYGKSVPFTLNPASFEPQRNLLFRNDGSGRFVEVAAELGADNPEGRSLGAVWHDFDGDGRLDLYVANDISDNVLLWNAGTRFEDRSHEAWVADYRGAMGLAVADWNEDGDDDLFVSHWVAQENALYDSLAAQLGEGETRLRFMDVADERGLGQIALARVGWGSEFLDIDGDGWLDLAVANGSTFETGDVPPRLQSQPMFLFWNRRGEGFHDLAASSPALARAIVGRGLATADADGDGDPDLLVIDLAGGVRLLRNDVRQAGPGLRLRLLGGAGGRGDGARLEVQVGDRRLRRSLTSASYLSQSSHTVLVGLDGAPGADGLTVWWSDGRVDRWGPLAAGGWDLRPGEEPRPRDIGSSPALERSEPRPVDRERVEAFWRAERAGVRAMRVDGDLPRAAVLLREALAIDPDHEDTLYYLGQCLQALDDRQGALAAFDHLVQVNPMSHRGWRGWALLRAAPPATEADLEAARDALLRAVEINREETGALLVLAEVELLLGENAAAGQRLARISRTNPRSVGSYFLRAYLAWSAGDDLRARELLEQGRAAAPPAPSGATSEGDAARRMHSEVTLLSRFWTDRDDGSADLPAVFAPLQAYLAGRR